MQTMNRTRGCFVDKDKIAGILKETIDLQKNVNDLVLSESSKRQNEQRLNITRQSHEHFTLKEKYLTTLNENRRCLEILNSLP